MPADALPRPWPTPPAGLVNYRREYRDALGRPMKGSVTITGSRGLTAAPVVAVLTGGALDVDLQPDTYTLQAALHTVDGGRINDRDTIDLT